MDTVIRVAVIYVFVMFTLRILGKRELGEISPHELVMIMLIPEIASQSMVGEDFSLTNALIGISTLLCLVFLNSTLGYRFKKLRMIVEGEPIVLFYQGQFNERAMDRERVDADEIQSEARAAGLESLDKVKWAILEPDGKISCIPYAGPGR